MNTSDSEHLSGLLLTSGMTASQTPEESDLIIVNTCAVREKSEEKLYSLLGRLENLKKERGTKIGIVGCVAQLYKSKLWDRKPTLDFIVGPDNYTKIPELILSQSHEKALYTEWSTEWHDQSIQQIKRESNVSAFITIMEGCNNFCAYCVVPFTRGREKYRPIRQILAEAEDLASKGYKEIQLLGQNVNSYVDPETRKNFAVLLREINNVSNIEWIRFITSHPKNFTDEIVYAMQDSDKVCHQLHLPIQSGSTSVLKRMNRGYTREEYCEKIDLLRQLMPDIHLSTDIIVGFPGETKDEFHETLGLLKQIRYTNIFSFRYCPRPHTAAGKKEDNVAFEEKKNRLIQVQALQKKIQLEKNRSMIGQIQKVICTGISKKNPEVYSGRNNGYQVVNFTSSKNVLDQFIQVKILACGPYSLFGEVAEHSL